MQTAFSRLVAMSPRALAAAVALLSAGAFAQSDDYSAPPMVPVDAEPEGELQPQSRQPVQMIPADPSQPQQPQQPQPQQQPQQPQYQPYPQQQQPQYQNPQYQQPYPQQQQPQYQDPQYQQQYPQQYQQQQPQQQRPQQPAAEPVFEGTFLESTRTKHFLGMGQAGVGVFTGQPGLSLNVRAEADIGKLPIFVGYTRFIPDGPSPSLGHFTAMTGWSFFSSDVATLRALVGVDVIDANGLVATGAVFGSTFRSMFARSLGFDAAVMFTPFPFRQLEVRAAFVIQFWKVFELQLGWRYQAIDATQSGDLGTLFNIAPAVNGPAVGIGLTF